MSIVLIDNDSSSELDLQEPVVSQNQELLRQSTSEQELRPICNATTIKDQYNSSLILQSLLTSKDYNEKILKLIEKYDSCHSLSYDILIQNERGGTWFGIQMFSASLLIPKFDPPGLTTLNGDSIQSMKLFPLKNELEWKWFWDQWYVLMLDDTDDKGWVYSTGFRSKNWRGCFKFFGFTFVRRRLWIRLRQKVKK